MAQWSLIFDGTDDYVRCGDVPTGGLTALTVECWLRLDADEAGAAVAKWGATSNDQEWKLEIESGRTFKFTVALLVDESIVTKSVQSDALDVGSWYHVAGVLGTDALQLYVDGSLKDEEPTTDTETIVASSQAMELGRLGSAYAAMRLAWVRISDSARYTGSFTLPKSPPFPDDHTLVQYDFIEGQGSSLNNRESTSSYDGAISNATWSLDVPAGAWTDSYQKWGDAWTVLLNGVDRTSVTALESIVVMEEVRGRQTAVFQLEDVSTSVTVQSWQHVQIWHGGTLMFGGLVVAYDIIPRGVYRDLICHCVDWSALVAKAYKAAEVYTNDTVAEILADVFAGAGLTDFDVVTYVSSETVIELYEVDYDYVDEIIDNLAEALGYAWFVRENEEGDIYLHFGDMSDSAPFDLSTSPNLATTFPMQVIQWSVSGSEIVNYVQFVITELPGATEYTTGGTLGDTVVYQGQTLLGTQNSASITQYGRELNLLIKCQRGQADAYTSDWLASEAFEKVTGTLRIWQAGIRPGMTIHVTHAVLDVDADYIVRRVQARPEGGSAVAFELQVGGSQRTLASHLADIARVARRAVSWDRENVVVRNP